MYSIRKNEQILIESKNKESKERENSNVFDPSKFSPPNEFLVKLQERLSNYSPTKKY